MLYLISVTVSIIFFGLMNYFGDYVYWFVWNYWWIPLGFLVGSAIYGCYQDLKNVEERGDIPE